MNQIVLLESSDVSHIGYMFGRGNGPGSRVRERYRQSSIVTTLGSVSGDSIDSVYLWPDDHAPTVPSSPQRRNGNTVQDNMITDAKLAVSGATVR